MKKTAILGIDLQNDFVSTNGNLSVAGAEKDVRNICQFIKSNASKIDYIALSLDSHQPIHIANQCYWQDAEGNPPNLFESITHSDLDAGKWKPKFNKHLASKYLSEIEATGSTCTIWPPHCILGTEGWAIDKQLTDMLYEWSVSQNKQYELFYKGYHQATEHYSIFKAAVQYDDTPETKLNIALLEKLNSFDELIIVGEAADFCVANSLNDIVDEMPDLAKKTIMLTDCMSWIIKENKKAESIFNKAQTMGVQFKTSTNYSL